MRHGRPSRLARVRALTVVGVRAGALVLLLAGAWSLYVASAASASTTNGTATIADPTDVALASGGSATNFTVTLPDQAACSGDSATGGYRVFSYMVPRGTSPSTISFSTGDPSTGYGFFSSTGTLYESVNTATTTGQIIGIPVFEWGPAVVSYGLLTASASEPALLYTGGTSGVWEAGIACANSSGTVTDWWNTEITFTSSTSDPDKFVWSAVPGPPGSTTSGSTTTTTTGSTSGSTTTTTTGSTSGSTTTTTTGSTSGSTTTTTSGSTSGSTTTTTSGSTSGSTTTTTVAAATQSGSSTDGDATSNGDPSATDPSPGTLASTGAPIVRDVAMGLLCIGLGLILLGWSAKSRWARAALPVGVWR